MSDKNSNSSSNTQRGNWGFSLLAVQLILQGAFMALGPATDELEIVKIGLGIMAGIAGLLILVGK